MDDQEPPAAQAAPVIDEIWNAAGSDEPIPVSPPPRAPRKRSRSPPDDKNSEAAMTAREAKNHQWKREGAKADAA